MLCLQSISIEQTDTAETLHDKLAELAVQPLLQTLETIADGTVNRTPQQNENATLHLKLQKKKRV